MTKLLKSKMNSLTEWLDQQAYPMILYLLLFLLFILVVIWFHKPESKKISLPPSPTKLPIIGNLHQLRGLPHHALQALAQKYGPFMFLHFGRVPTLVVSSADGARAVMKTYDHVLSSRPELEIPNRLLYGKDVAFVPYGEYWRQVRKICVSQLLSAKKVKSFRFVREEEVALLLDMIKESSFSGSINLSKLFNSITNDITCRIVLGKKYNERDGGRRFKDVLEEFTYLLGCSNIGDFIPSLSWVNKLNGLYARVEKNFREFDSFLDEVVEEHIVKTRNIGSEEEEEDFVDVMLRVEKDSTLGVPITRDHTKAVILDMFAAGTDTSAVVLEWAMSELLKHHGIMEEVQQEVRDIAAGKLVLMESDTEEMHYLRSVIKEAIRLHPPIPFLVPRESMKNVRIQGYDIPAKTTIIINAFTIGRDPTSWEEPERFWPKRFLDGGSSVSVDFKGQHFQLIPFGAGRRGCPGMLFATATAEIALANLLNRFDWSLPNGMEGKDLDMLEIGGLTIRRMNELVLIGKPRYQSDTR